MPTRIPKELIKDLNTIENNGNTGSSEPISFELDKVVVREGILESGVYSFTTDKVANASDSYTELYLDGVKVPTGNYNLTTRENDTLVTLKYAVSKDTWFNITIFQGLNIEATRDTRVDIWETGPGIPFDYGIDPNDDDGTEGIKFQVCSNASNVNYFYSTGTAPINEFDVYINDELTEQKFNSLTFNTGDKIEIKKKAGSTVQFYPFFKPGNTSNSSNPNTTIQKILKPFPVMCYNWNSPSAYTDYSSMFNYCKALTDICNGLFRNVKEIIVNVRNIFSNCSQLRYAPSDLFSNCVNLTNASQCFNSCTNLKTIGSNLFYNCIKLNEISAMFTNCTHLTSIGSNTFANCRSIVTSSSTTSTSNVVSVFSALKSNLTELGSGTFANCESIYTCANIFKDFTKLRSIGSNTFANCINCSSFHSAFEGCSSLEEIDESTFINCEAVLDFQYVFCYTKIKNIPVNIFRYSPNATHFIHTFNSTPITEIPEDLFKYNIHVNYFEYVFTKCTNLTSIPANLFSNNIDVTNFTSIFSSCTSLTNVPSTLFDSNTKVTKVDNAFNGCTSITSSVPELWNRTNISSYSKCFYNCTNAANYADIPSDWR